MPRFKRSKGGRSRFKRKRRPNKSRGKRKRKGSLAKKILAVMNRQNQQKRTVKNQTRQQGFETVTDMTCLIPLIVCGTRPNMEAMMDTAIFEGYKHGLGFDTSTDVAKAGQYISPQGQLVDRPTGAQYEDGGTALQDRYLCKFQGYKNYVHIKNSELMPIDVTLYEIVAKVNRSLDLEPYAQISDDIYNGLKTNESATSVSTATLVSGDSLYSQVPTSGDFNAHINSWDHSVQPSQSVLFRGFWKTVKKKSFRLQPGDEIRWKAPTINYTYSPKQLLMPDSAENVDIVKGVTRCLLAKVTGMLGRSKIAGEENVIGRLSAELLYESSCRATLIPHLSVPFKPIQLTTIAKDDLSAATLRYQVEHAHQDDDDDT